MCAQEHTGDTREIDGVTIFTCDCDLDDDVDFLVDYFWQTCLKKDTTGQARGAYFVYEPTKDRGGVDEELWMRIGVKDGIVAGFNYETATVLITVKISQVDDAMARIQDQSSG
jgi:hypothetical protein